MFGDDIFILLQNIGKSYKHFDDYAEFIRKRDHPTPEEISEKEKQEEITNKYKASSRLERLKAKNNC